MFRRFLLRSAGLVGVVALLGFFAQAPNPLVAALGWAVFAYLVVCAMPVMVRHARAVASLAGVQPRGRFSRIRRPDSGTL